MEEDIRIRKQPEQQRSKQTVDTILASAAQLIGEHGMDSTSMTMIAKEAQMSKAALYRYFPNMKSLLRALAEQSLEEGANSLNNLLDSELSIHQMIESGVSEYCKTHRDNPFLVSLRGAIYSDPTLAGLDMDDSQKNADKLKNFLVTKYPDICDQTASSQSLLFVECIGTLARLCCQLDSHRAKALENTFVKLFTNEWERNS